MRCVEQRVFVVFVVFDLTLYNVDHMTQSNVILPSLNLIHWPRVVNRWICFLALKINVTLSAEKKQLAL